MNNYWLKALYCTLLQGSSLVWFCGLGFGATGGRVLSEDPARAFGLWKAGGASVR